MLGETCIVFHVMIYRGFADTSKKHITNNLTVVIEVFFFSFLNV